MSSARDPAPDPDASARAAAQFVPWWCPPQGAVAPVAIVGLGDPTHRDEALPARVLGRARTLIADIGRIRWAEREAPEASAVGRSGGEVESRESDLSDLDPVPTPDTDPDGASLVEWVEAGGASARLDRVLAGRRRVVLVDTLALDGKPGTVYHWHVERSGDLLGRVQHYHRSPRLGMEHLAFWLEDDLPGGGLDLIGIEPCDTTRGVGLSDPIRRRLGTISSQVAAILFRILSEEGW